MDSELGRKDSILKTTPPKDPKHPPHQCRTCSEVETTIFDYWISVIHFSKTPMKTEIIIVKKNWGRLFSCVNTHQNSSVAPVPWQGLGQLCRWGLCGGRWVNLTVRVVWNRIGKNAQQSPLCLGARSNQRVQGKTQCQMSSYLISDASKNTQERGHTLTRNRTNYLFLD